ncbi:hypothetical protein PHLGIDRAFT_78369 [Phlebiopsis gigantea 11061_1 CR5-6]|uniref:Protein kinase domain-containing protein n=1 Tax=Phlebiopsis gigantea (strain 11061_1 CR5-6) TaxID=745531 RepID=A0A0C3S4G1_PHLG1|nr:hypothetical protein PHLGIDRAFT_78369 [Phlebiopsis gigantea 11061_1 CR5-6]
MEVVQTWTLKHPRVISLLGVTHTFGGISLIVPWMKNKTIHRCLNAKKKEKGAKTPLIVNVAEGLAYLHAEGIVHGDLRGDNVLVDGNYKAVIADFGLTTFAHGHSRNYASIRKGDSGWSAPELLNSKDGYSSRQTSASDVYAFAIVCIEIYLGRAPFNKEDGSMAFCRRVMDGLRPDRPEVPVRLDEQSHGELMRDDLWEVVSECWDGDKSKRPTARNALRRLVSSRS